MIEKVTKRSFISLDIEVARYPPHEVSAGQANPHSDSHTRVKSSTPFTKRNFSSAISVVNCETRRGTKARDPERGDRFSLWARPMPQPQPTGWRHQNISRFESRTSTSQNPLRKSNGWKGHNNLSSRESFARRCRTTQRGAAKRPNR